MPNTSLYLRTLANPTTRRVKPEGLPTHRRMKLGTKKVEVPVAYFEKSAISAGSYTHPATGEKFTVTPKRIDKWVSRFHSMRKRGIEVPTPVDHSDSAEDNLGFVVDAYRKGKTLKLVHQAIGKDAAIVAARNRCSVFIDPEYVDCKGRNWGEAIAHSSYTAKPVVHGHGEFVPFAASRVAGKRRKIPVFYFSRTSTENDMGDLLDAKTKAKIRKMLKLPKGTEIKTSDLIGKLVTTNDKLSKKLSKVRTSSKGKVKDEDGGDEDDEDDEEDEEEEQSAGDTDDTDEEDDEEESDAEDAEDDDEEDEEPSARRSKADRRTHAALKLSRIRPLDSNGAVLMRRAFKTEKKKAIEAGGVSVEIADKMEKLLCPGGDLNNGLALSRASRNGDPLIFELFRLLRRNNPVSKFGDGRTGSQSNIGALSRASVRNKKSDDSQPTEQELEEIRAETRKHMSRMQGKKTGGNGINGNSVAKLD